VVENRKFKQKPAPNSPFQNDGFKLMALVLKNYLHNNSDSEFQRKKPGGARND
jgi:hypothetical protein